MSAAVEALRARISELEGGTLVTRRPVPTRVEALDRLVGGLPRPGMVEVSGLAGSGVTRLALSVVAALGSDEPVAWVDGDRALYPPAAADLGVDLTRLLIVRPPAHGAGWAAEQLARSGCFALVVVSSPAAPGRTGPRLAHAAEHGGCTAMVLVPHSHRGLPADLRLAVRHDHVAVTRHRGGRLGAAGPLPEWPEGWAP